MKKATRLSSSGFRVFQLSTGRASIKLESVTDTEVVAGSATRSVGAGGQVGRRAASRCAHDGRVVLAVLDARARHRGVQGRALRQVVHVAQSQLVRGRIEV